MSYLSRAAGAGSHVARMVLLEYRHEHGLIDEEQLHAGLEQLAEEGMIWAQLATAARYKYAQGG